MSAVLTDEQRETVLANVPLVEHIVNRMAASLPASYSRDDLVQTGVLGLISAAARFDPDAGVAFSTYAGRRIEGSIIDLLRSSDWAPRSVRSLERRLQAAEEKLSRADGGGSPAELARSEHRVAQELDCSTADVKRLRQDIAKARLDSLDRPVSVGDEQLTVSDSVADQGTGTEELIDDRELVGYLRNGIALLPERHRLVVVGFFFHDRSITELGELLGVTQSRASQIKDEALRLLRAGMEEAYDDHGPPGGKQTLTSRQRRFAQAVAKSAPLAPTPINQLA
jgi:RNA polymerase sigma factor for flagellar operon FliA